MEVKREMKMQLLKGKRRMTNGGGTLKLNIDENGESRGGSEGGRGRVKGERERDTKREHR